MKGGREGGFERLVSELRRVSDEGGGRRREEEKVSFDLLDEQASGKN